jgi:hypothetical protein
MRSNELGFKSTTTGPLPPKGQRQRLLFLGDSYTEGVGVGPENVFVTRIGQLLPDTQTLNAGVSSYAPIIYERKLRYLLEQKHLDVDAVVVFLDISDIEDEAMYYNHGPNDDVEENYYYRRMYARKGIKMETKLPAWDLSSQSRGFWERHTVLIARLIGAWRSRFGYPPSLLLATGSRRALWTLDEQTWKDYGERGLDNATRDMGKLAGYLRARNIPLTLVVYPWPDQILHHDLNSRQVRHWRAWSAAEGVDFLNLFPLFMSPRSPQELATLFIPGDAHWSRAGHELVAHAFVEHWRQRSRRPL